MGRIKKRDINGDARKIRIAPFVAILIFLILGMIGISQGEPARVLEQATQICLSCIGIG